MKRISHGPFVVPQKAVQLTFCYLSIDERLPGGPAVSVSSHLISPMARPKLCYVELMLTGGVLDTFLATEISQQQHSDLVKIFISLSSVLKYCMAIVPHWKRSRLQSRSHQKCQKMRTIFSCILVSTVCPLRVWTTTLLRLKPWARRIRG